MRVDHKTKLAIQRYIVELIKADDVIDMREIQWLERMEQTYGFDRSLMSEALQMSLADAANHLAHIDKAVRQPLFDELNELATSDKICLPAEAMILLALQYEAIALPKSVHRGGLGPYVIYLESTRNEARHEELAEQFELLQLMLHQQGLGFIYIEKMAQELAEQDSLMMRKVLGYMAPQHTDAQIEKAYQRMKAMDTPTFCNQVLVRNLLIDEVRDSEPSLLVCTPSTLLRIPLGKESMYSHVKRFCSTYSALISPGQRGGNLLSDNLAQSLPFAGYYRIFFKFLLKAEPTESQIIIWPNKSDFEFPEAGRTLHLNQQEASLYTLILIKSVEGSQGLPLCYTPEQKRIEQMYRTIYCRKKLIETDEVIYPDNLAPIRAKIERKMREQLAGLSNLEEFIPYNENRKGFYRVRALPQIVWVKPDSRSEKVALTDFKF